MPGLPIIDDTAKSAAGKRKQLDQVAEAPDEDLLSLTPAQIRDMAKKGAALDENGEPEEKDGKGEDKPSSLKIKITLNLDVEIHLTARIKGDITIGLL